MLSSESVKGLLKRQTLNQPKLIELDKVLHKCLTAMRCEGKHVPGPAIIENLSLFMIK